MIWLLYAVGSAALLILGFGVPAYFRKAMRDVQRYEQAAVRFLDKADTLMSDPDIPVGVLDRLEFLAERISDRRAVDGLMAALFAKDKISPKGAPDYKEVQSFFDRRPELHRAYSEATGCAMLAVFYNGSGMRGFLARIWLSSLIRRVDSERTVEEIKSRNRNDIHHDGNFAAAI